MAKNPNNRPKAAKWDDPMNSAMKFFLSGCVAELYLLLIRRFYVYGTLEQVVAWDGYLKVLAWAGLVILAVGAVLSAVWRADRSRRQIGWGLAIAGAFVGAVSAVVRLNMSVLTLLYLVVPAVMLLGILWSLYDRECALSLTILGVSLLALWVCRREVGNLYTGTYFKVGAAVYVLLMVAAAAATWKAAASGGRLGKLQLLSPKGDAVSIYVACGLSAAAMLTVLISVSVSYYAMWILAGVVFALAVYYTVKQL